MQDASPRNIDHATLDELEQRHGKDVVEAQLFYLAEHDLSERACTLESSGHVVVNMSRLKITTTGLDFIADDGGVTAIRGPVTITILDETIKQVIAARVVESDLALDQKR